MRKEIKRVGNGVLKDEFLSEQLHSQSPIEYVAKVAYRVASVVLEDREPNAHEVGLAYKLSDWARSMTEV